MPVRTMRLMEILVVDDERAVRDSLRRALELEGYSVELAEDGEQALRRLELEPQPDAVILDILMPGADGLEVCRRLRRSGNGIPVLMLTARTKVDSRVAGLDAGADDYLAEAVRARGAARSPARSLEKAGERGRRVGHSPLRRSRARSWHARSSASWRSDRPH